MQYDSSLIDTHHAKVSRGSHPITVMLVIIILSTALWVAIMNGQAIAVQQQQQQQQQQDSQWLDWEGYAALLAVFAGAFATWLGFKKENRALDVDEKRQMQEQMQEHSKWVRSQLEQVQSQLQEKD